MKKIPSSIEILYEDEHMIAVNKPARMMSLPAEGIPLEKTALGVVQHMFQEKGVKPYLLHRLDYPTSGVLLFGKFPRDREKLEAIFQHEKTEKVYHTLVIGIPKGNEIVFRLKARSSKEFISAQTNFTIIKVYNVLGIPCSLVAATIKTGRKHQIRQHFSQIGHPVIMDSTYGNFRFNRRFRMTYRLGSQFLHAAHMSFVHPFTEQEVRIEAPYSAELDQVLKRISK